jgi:exopolysaccharide production protein ExoZ
VTPAAANALSFSPKTGIIMTSKLIGVQLLRAYAASLVVLWHVGGIAKNFPDVDTAPPPFLQFGYAGVDLFFVISGFIICTVGLKGPFDWQSFAWKRFFRIYPFYAFFSMLVLAALFINPHWTLTSVQPTTLSIVKSFLIFPQEQRPLLFVGWSLEHEIQFYIAAAFMFWLGYPRFLPVILLCQFVLGVAVSVVFNARYWDLHLLSLYHLEFALGTLVYFWQDRLRGPSWPPLLAGVFLFGVTAWVVESVATQQFLVSHVPAALALPDLIRVCGYGLGSACLLVAALNGNFSPRSVMLSNILAIGVLLGDASYTLYLSHAFILSIVAKIGLALGAHGFAVYAVLLSAVMLACMAAISFYICVERPALHIFQRHDRASIKRALPA